MISIIIPIYNQAKHLDNCLASIYRQTYLNFEIIVIDDGSTDRIEPLMNKYFKIYGHKIAYYDQNNQGANVARNRGAKIAKGEYLLFCDADLTMIPNMLMVMSDTLKNNLQASFAYSSFKRSWKTFKCGPYLAEKLKQMPYINTTSLIRREHFPGFDEQIKKFQDWDLWLTMLEAGHTGIWIDQILYTIKTSGQQSMSSWLPSLAYKFLPNLPQVKKYYQAMAIIKQKHHLI